MTQVIMTTLTKDELVGDIANAVVRILKEKELNPNAEEQMIKIKELAQNLGVSQQTIHAWKRAGLIPFYRISSKVYFRLTEVIEAMKKINRRKV